MPETDDNRRTALAPDDAAIVVNSNGEARLSMPDHKDDEEVPRHILFLTAVMMKLGDEAWVDELIADCFKQD
jgi:hypothetical protein